jgi:phosphoglycerol transferase MdoB-like AlkP superfamily enzyme
LQSLPKNKPFFAYIQTAGNHEPFTIPNEGSGFEVSNPPEETLRLAGFRNARQFNAVRLLDFSVGRFMEMAKKGGYFDNTIFVFFGDHNNSITTVPFMPPAFEKLGIESNHVPAFIYAPKLIKPMQFKEAASLVDLVPTVMSLTGKKYVNTTLGRDIMKPAPEGVRAVPTMFGDGRQSRIGVVTKDYYLHMNTDGADVKMHDLQSKQPLDNVATQHPEEFNRLSTLTRGLHETARFMMYKNVAN